MAPVVPSHCPPGYGYEGYTCPTVEFEDVQFEKMSPRNPWVALYAAA